MMDQRWFEEPPRSRGIRRRIRIQVTPRGQVVARQAAEIRQRANERRGYQDTAGLEAERGFETHHMGTLSEAGIREFLGIELEPLLVNRPVEEYRKPSIAPNLWVRTASKLTYRLRLRKVDENYKDDLVAFAPIGSLKDGWIVLAGWLRIRDGLKPCFFDNVRPDRPEAQYWIPQGALEPAGTFETAWFEEHTQPRLL